MIDILKLNEELEQMIATRVAEDMGVIPMSQQKRSDKYDDLQRR